MLTTVRSESSAPRSTGAAGSARCTGFVAHVWKATSGQKRRSTTGPLPPWRMSQNYLITEYRHSLRTSVAPVVPPRSTWLPGELRAPGDRGTPRAAPVSCGRMLERRHGSLCTHGSKPRTASDADFSCFTGPAEFVVPCHAPSGRITKRCT